MVLSIPDVERVWLQSSQDPRNWFEEFISSSLHTHFSLDLYDAELLAGESIESIREKLGATLLNGWIIDKPLVQVAALLGTLLKE